MLRKMLLYFTFLTTSVTVCFFPAPTLQAKTTTIKIAVIMPEGSTWTNTLYKLTREVKQKTNGEVDFKIYAGGVSGDEVDVLRKMQVNRIHAAGLSGNGLGFILPEIRILESILLFRNNDEVDKVKMELYHNFAEKFEKKGFVLLGFFEAGFAYLFSQKPMTGPEGLQSVNMWVWKGDQIATTYLETLGVKTVPLPMTDVNTGLETGMIDSYYCPPLAAVALQWYQRARYMLDYPLAHSLGALLINKKVFNKLSDQNKTILRDTVQKYCQALIRLSRKENTEARGILKESGIIFEKLPEQQAALLKKSAQIAFEKNIPSVYSRQLLERVQAILEAFRTQKTNTKTNG